MNYDKSNHELVLHLRGCMYGSYRQYRRVVYVSLHTGRKLLTFRKHSVPLASGSHFHPEERRD